MDAPSNEDVVNFIRDAIAERAGGGTLSDSGQVGVLGADLGTALRVKFPEWNAKKAGHGSLRKFMSTIPGIYEIGRQGNDIIFSDAMPANEDESAKTPSDPGKPSKSDGNEWRVWASPRSSYVILVDPKTLATRTVAGDAAEQHGDAIAISPMSAEQHRSMARAFVEQAPEGTRQALASLVDSPDPYWWKTWFEHISELGKAQEWFTHRQEYLLAALTNELKAASVDEDAASSVAAGILESSSRNKAAPPSKGRHPQRILSARPEHELDLRRVVTLALTELSDRELSSLKLPVGAVLKALRRY